MPWEFRLHHRSDIIVRIHFTYGGTGRTPLGNPEIAFAVHSQSFRIIELSLSPVPIHCSCTASSNNRNIITVFRLLPVLELEPGYGPLGSLYRNLIQSRFLGRKHDGKIPGIVFEHLGLEFAHENPVLPEDFAEIPSENLDYPA